MKKPDFYGVGPRIGRIVLPFWAVTIALTFIFPSVFKFPAGCKTCTLWSGIIFLALALVLYGITVRNLVSGLKEGRLVTTGAFRYCQNPLYAVLLLLVIPGVGLLLNSWLVLTTPVVGYIAFKKYIGGEYEKLKELFGDEYLDYQKRTPEFFPFIK